MRFRSVGGSLESLHQTEREDIVTCINGWWIVHCCDPVHEEVKQRRIIICTKAIGATSLLGPWWTPRRVLFGDWHGFSRSVHFGLFIQGWMSISQLVTAFYAQV